MLRNNINQKRLSLPSNCKLMLIVKANAYGCGINAAKLIEESADSFGVARVSEAIELRNLGITKPILALSSYRGEYIDAKYRDISVAVSTIDDINMAVEHSLAIHIAIDCGMNRYGFKNTDYERLINYCKSINADIRGVFSHIYHNTAQIIDSEIKRFNIAERAVKSVYPNATAHIASSGSLDYNSATFDMVRLGLDLYAESTYITSRVILIKDILPSESVSYGGLFVAKKPLKIAIIEGGYADGILKSFCGIQVYIKGQPAMILGAVCMDCCMVDITNIDCEVGDAVLICGGDNSTEVIASMMNISEYELLTGLKGRYNYVYYN